jgi:hypothetical protein
VIAPAELSDPILCGKAIVITQKEGTIIRDEGSALLDCSGRNVEIDIRLDATTRTELVFERAESSSAANRDRQNVDCSNNFFYLRRLASGRDDFAAT